MENIALSADDQDKHSKKYQQTVIKIRNEGAADWKALNKKEDDGLARDEAYSFYMITFYVLRDQFTYMVKHGSGDISNIALSLQDTSILTSNVEMVLYNISGWTTSKPWPPMAWPLPLTARSARPIYEESPATTPNVLVRQVGMEGNIVHYCGWRRYR